MSIPSGSHPAPVHSPQVPCPKCRKPVVDPEGLGWCRACGYCSSLEDHPKQMPAATAKPARLEPPGASAGTTMPIWPFVMLVGMVLIVGATFACGHYLKVTPIQRAVLTTVQIGAGILIMFVGQLIGLIRLAPQEATLSFKDAIFPFTLYGVVIKHLPRSSLTIYTGSWGATAIVAAVVFIGGLGHWFNYIPAASKNQTQKSGLR